MKTAKKTAKPGRNGNVLPMVGDHPGNTGGKPGRSGRRPSEITALCQQLVRDHKILETVILPIAQHANKQSDQLAAARLLLEYGEGKPVLRQEITGADGDRLSVGLHIFEGDEHSD